jgi:hypothetical protein
MKTVGFYRELDPKSSFATGSIHDAVGEQARADEDRVVEYLESGYGIIDYTESGLDVLGSGAMNVGCSSVISDGEWIWRQDLAFYVRRYHLALPEEFLDHVRSNGYTVPPENIPKLIERTQEFHAAGG